MTFNFIKSFLKSQKVRTYSICLCFTVLCILFFVTYSFFSDVNTYSKNSSKVVFLLYMDVILILTFLFLCLNKIIHIWSLRNKKKSRLTLRLIGTFSLLSVIPSIMMCIFSAMFFHSGIESWFDERNKTVLKESSIVARSYLAEHRRIALEDNVRIARTVEYNLNNMKDIFIKNKNSFYNSICVLLDDLCGLKNVSSAILLDSNLNIVAHSKYSVSLFFTTFLYDELKQILEKSAIYLNTAQENRIVTVSCFKNPINENMFLIAEKKIDEQTISHARNTEIAYNEYLELQKNRQSLEIAFVILFLLIGIILLLLSIVLAISYSLRIINPIDNLINISEKITLGNLNARVIEESQYDEILLLTKTFNKMITNIHDHQNDLLSVNQELDERMKFTSSVLAGVSSGVIGVDNEHIYIWNNAAEKLLGKNIKYGDLITDLISDINDILQSLNNNVSFVEKETQYVKDGAVMLFLIKIEDISISSNENKRFVMTFDDLTHLVAVQRKAAWEEVARRVAHEIKNPLTPIQLAAERLRRKYIKQIDTDKELFSELVTIIVRQVGDIKRLLDEFNFFARVPEPVLKYHDICDVCKQAVLFMKTAVDDIHMEFSSNVSSKEIKIDDRLMHQAIVNIIQNAVNALRTVSFEDKKINVYIESTESDVSIFIEDNGPGLPNEKREYLATAYFTLMPKGTGLGLAIVKKLIQDHSGTLSFDDSQLGGAKVTIKLPIT